MWGAIIGDLAGSIYEYEQFKNVSKIDVKEIISKNSFFSDDTILTIAILDALLNNRDYDYYLKLYTKEYAQYKPSFEPYFKSSFSPNFIKWVYNGGIGTSIGNGAMMRISAIGYLCKSEAEVIEQSMKATAPSHNSKEAIACATTVALIIFLAKNGYSKQDIITKLNINCSYQAFKKFNSTCSETINNCLYALFTSNSFDESIRKVISFGGDTDTNACIVGSMAEALYGIDEILINQASEIIPPEFTKKLKIGYSKI